MRGKLGWIIGTVGVVTLFIVSSWGLAAPTTPATTAPSKLTQFRSAISHIVFLMQENHAYDSLYGTYCLAAAKYCPNAGNGLSPNPCVAKYPAHKGLGCVTPYNFTVAQESPASDMPHDWNSTHLAYDKGAMDNFYTAEKGNLEAFGHYNGTTAPVYWDLAEQYGLADNFFASSASYSLPNHWYMVSNTIPNASNLIKVLIAPVSQQHEYLNQSNRTPAISDELVNSSVSWSWYDYALPPIYKNAIHINPNGVAYDYWDPLAARAQSYQAAERSHFQNRSAFFSDAANGTLPNISWIIPSVPESDHPVYNITTGQDWVASVVDALELSPEWNSTVLFVSWDEYGGFYDHVAPPQLDANGDGFRVPLLAIGPWVRQGSIDHDQMDFDSVLHLMEERFGLTCLGPRDCKAKLPLGLFNFNRAPRAPIQIFPYAQASYPMPLQSSGKLPYYGARMGAVPVGYTEPVMVPMDPEIDWA